MNVKRLIGIVLLALGLLLLAFVIVSVTLNMDQTGPWAYRITTYRPPFYAHGLWMVLCIICSGFSLLGGGLLLALSRYD